MEDLHSLCLSVLPMFPWNHRILRRVINRRTSMSKKKCISLSCWIVNLNFVIKIFMYIGVKEFL